MDPELEAFIPLFPRADLTDPVAERKNFAELAAAVPAPDTSGMEVEDRMMPADPDVLAQSQQEDDGSRRTTATRTDAPDEACEILGTPRPAGGSPVAS
ncbi:hypothetical protein [Streptomyces dysideae]|nr:hypothetical protein [Streptomyces dysideae]